MSLLNLDFDVKSEVEIIVPLYLDTIDGLRVIVKYFRDYSEITLKESYPSKDEGFEAIKDFLNLNTDVITHIEFNTSIDVLFEAPYFILKMKEIAALDPNDFNLIINVSDFTFNETLDEAQRVYENWGASDIAKIFHNNLVKLNRVLYKYTNELSSFLFFLNAYEKLEKHHKEYFVEYLATFGTDFVELHNDKLENTQEHFKSLVSDLDNVYIGDEVAALDYINDVLEEQAEAPVAYSEVRKTLEANILNPDSGWHRLRGKYFFAV